MIIKNYNKTIMTQKDYDEYINYKLMRIKSARK